MEVKTKKLPKAKNTGDQVMIGFNFASDWLALISEPITINYSALSHEMCGSLAVMQSDG